MLLLSVAAGQRRLGEGRPTAHVIREALERYANDAREQERALPAFVGLAAASEIAPARADRDSGGGDRVVETE